MHKMTHTATSRLTRPAATPGRDFMLRYAADYGVAATEGTEHAPKWDSLIETSLALLSDSQCADTGLVVSDCISNMRWRERVCPCMLATGGAGTPRLVGGLLTLALADMCVPTCRVSAKLVRAQRRHDRLLGLRHPGRRVWLGGLAHYVARCA